MSFAAVFVDAGYLYAQGAVAMTGAQLRRADVRLDEAAVVRSLKAFAVERSEGARLLRIYWYDAPLKTGVTAQQAALGATDHIKLRLGVLNGLGQQKGVDSLIVSDLIELARNRAISDAILLSGDEDVRVGVQVAQSHGVRIHLLGLSPARGSQSPTLRQEADTTSEWGAGDLAAFMGVTARAAAPVQADAAKAAAALLPSPQAEIVDEAVAGLPEGTLADLAAYWASRAGLPPEIDRPLLARCRDALQRDLEPKERREVRKAFVVAVKAMPEYRTVA